MTDADTIAAPAWESSALTVEEAATALLESEEETEQVEESADDAEEATADDETDETDDSDEEEESEDTLEESQPADDPVAKKEKELLADYTRKTQEVAEKRKAAEAEATEYRAKREDYAEALKRIDAYLEATKPPEPDWAKLRTENPAEYAAQWAERQRWEHDQQTIKAEADKLAAEKAEENRQKAQAYEADQLERLLTAVPEWKDAEKFKEEGKALREFGIEAYGMEPELFETISDARFVLMLRDAMKYRNVATKTEKVLAKPSAVLKPGAREQPVTGKEKEIARLRKELRDTGSLRAAAKLYELEH
jgi:hypothetical protein